ncbi:hypothetical protein [Bradyrhizobium japonicum]|jgi:hypothetical protein|uniref:Uncharacterized protein n=1 Tax=Bradyrhizobium japonicum TaxID=375 RepID=A0ABV2RV47_BRAJP|nr:hypothetical protein [Bradyrhizobium japonicum]MCP1761725.1 hypothetical protein [Bradyrhizobium japonicum]MCP1793305.1 hypothetical protein [Bradyrhizobium japonicum]MCP1805738.1 hypothetical protein [Bradyrhizobium japonicum]MCP1814755.1 hypothetical protein [Bradyrhizobium japonicum]MCP1873816.1 hypothetical protein [Bradyrhizobium japonicum]
MERFFQLMEREPAVATYLVGHIVSLACAMEIDPRRPLELPLWLATRPALSPLWTRILVISADRAKPLQQAHIEERWTGDEPTRKYVGYAAGKPCLQITLDRELDMLRFTFL